MNCKKCGFVVTNQDKTCPNCGEVNDFYDENLKCKTDDRYSIVNVMKAEYKEKGKRR